MILYFLLGIGGIVWSWVAASQFLDKQITAKVIPDIVHRIDNLHNTWVLQNPMYRDRGREDYDEDNPVGKTNDIDLDDRRVIDADHGTTFNFAQIARGGVLIAFYMFVCNFLIGWGSISELIIGSLIGTATATLWGDVTKVKFLQNFAGISLLVAIIPVVVRNYIDTYRIGFWMFSLSSIILFFSQWLGILLYHLVMSSYRYHKNSKNIVILWIMIFAIILLL